MTTHEYLNKTLGYSNYEIAQIRYFISGLISEISKLILISGYFIYRDKLDLFISAVIVLCALRVYTGGIHFSHYLSCLAISFTIFYIAICILATIHIIKPLQIILLCLCIFINNTYAPIVSKYRPVPNRKKVQRSRKCSFWIIIIYEMILFILPDNPYTNIGFWIIIIHTIQLIIAKKLKEVSFL